MSLEFEEVCESKDENGNSPEDGYEDGANEVSEERRVCKHVKDSLYC